MGRKPLAGADEKILEAAIEVGGTSNANVLFSTEIIAEKAGVSEFAVFSRFQNKENLIIRALSLATARRTAVLKALVDAKLPFKDVVKGVESYLIQHPYETLFLVNYGESCARIGSSDQLHALFNKQCQIDRHLLDPYFHFDDEMTALIAYSTFIRNVLNDAQFVLSGFAVYDDHYKDLSAEIMEEGLRKERKDAPHPQ